MNTLSSLLNFIGSNFGKRFVVEKSSSNGWQYIKYSDGTFEANHYSNAGSTGTMSQIGSTGIYYSTPSQINMPSIGITEVRDLVVSCAPSENFLMHMVINRFSTSSFYVAYIRYGSGAAVSNINWWARIEGTWSNS